MSNTEDYNRCPLAYDRSNIRQSIDLQSSILKNVPYILADIKKITTLSSKNTSRKKDIMNICHLAFKG